MTSGLTSGHVKLNVRMEKDKNPFTSAKSLARSGANLLSSSLLEVCLHSSSVNISEK